MNNHLNNFQRNLYKQNYSLSNYEKESKINSFGNQDVEISYIESKKKFANNLSKKEELNKEENCKGEKLKMLITKPKSALFKNLKSANLNQFSHHNPFQKKFLIDTNIIKYDLNDILNGNNIDKSELKKSLLLEALIEKLKQKNENNGIIQQIEEKKEKKEKLNKKKIIDIKGKENNKDNKSIDKINKEKDGEYITPKKDEEEKEENDNKQHDKERIIIRIVRREKNNKEKKKKEKHQHQAKKEINEEENMSNFKSQNKDKSSIEVEYEEVVDESKKVPKEENDNIKNDGDKNGVIDEFLNEMEKKDINDKEKNDILNLDESMDPFTKAENEYRNKNENENMDKKDDLNTNLDTEINKLINEIQNENNINEDVNVEKIEEGKSNTYNTVENKDGKKKNFYRIYINSLNSENYNSFNPFMTKNSPGDLYLKEVREYQNNKEMMKNYRQKEKYNLFLNKVFSNKIIFKEKPSILLNNSNSRENIGNNVLENFKKLLKINLTKNNHKLKQNNYSLKSISNEYLINRFINTSPINKKKNYFKEKCEIIDSKLNVQNIIKCILEKEDEKIEKKLNPINSRRCSEPKNRIVDFLNDPHNPYSTIWPNRFLNVNYNMGIHYTDIEQGVPQLKIRNLKNKNLPPLYLRNKINNNTKSIFHTFSSWINLNQKSTLKDLINEVSGIKDNSRNNKKINDKISNKVFNLYRNNTEGNYNSNY